MMVVSMSLALGAIGLVVASCDGASESAPESLERLCVRERRIEARGAVEQRLVERWDARGRLIAAELTIEREEGVASDWVDASTTYTHDDAGRMVGASTTSAGPLGGAYSRSFAYDDRGRLVAMELSGDVTDFWARSLELQYVGDLALPTRVITVTGFTRTTDTYSFDDAGRPAARLRETGRVGSIEVELERETYVRDAAGALVETRYDRQADDSIDQVIRRERDAAGRIVRAGQFDPDGVWIEGNLYTWDAGRLVTLRWESSLDGIERFDFDYDASGQVSVTAASYGADGAVHHRNVLTGGRASAPCLEHASDALAAPLDRFYADPAAAWLYGHPGDPLP